MAAVSSSTETPHAAVSHSTPTKRATFSATEAGPSRAQVSGASPAYSSRRHSLYGIEDRIVIDPGSRIWKVGFSGEPDPRAVFWAQDGDSSGDEMWDLGLEKMERTFGNRNEGARMVGLRVIRRMRDVFTKHLMTDAKSRKVIVVENTYLPAFVKEHFAQALFDNLKVPSVSFTPSSLLALAACGRITGLVVDVGWLETTVTPVYYSRPLYHLSRSTPLAGRAVHRELRALLRYGATYVPPPTSLNTLTRKSIKPIPNAILMDKIVERVITEGCFVESMVLPNLEDQEMPLTAASEADGSEEALLAEDLRRRYASTSTATDLSFPIPPPAGTSPDMGFGTLTVPGWVRGRVAEVLFEGDPIAEAVPIPDVILQCILKLPTDLRSILVSSILVTGGTASLPGFIPRLRISLKSKLLASDNSANITISAPLYSAESRRAEIKEWRGQAGEPFKSLYGLVTKVAILNDPAPLDGGGEGGEGGSGANAGKAPRWVPSLMSWVGGSLAGVLKTGSPEILREEHDTIISESIARGETYRTQLKEDEEEIMASIGVDVEMLRPGEAVNGHVGKRRRGWKEEGIRDWTRPLIGAK